jgi:hypothetical protein
MGALPLSPADKMNTFETKKGLLTKISRHFRRIFHKSILLLKLIAYEKPI